MKALLELHILQNFAPSNLNRDDTGAPKDAVFGGFRRARVSSQCLKRAMRSYVRDRELLPDGNLARRTKRLLDILTEKLVASGHDATSAGAVAELAFGGLGLKIKDDGKSEYLLFLGDREIENAATVIHQHWDELASLVASSAGSEAKKKSSKDAKKDAKNLVPEEVKKALNRTIRERGQGGDAVDLALFGRMLADRPEKNQDAACQVAHAISTHKVDREFDFYTAVDDNKPEDTAGADMLGTVEFNSACFYRYLAIDLKQLLQNLQNDWELLEKGLAAFLEAAVQAVPTGKQNSFAAHNPPSFLAFTVRKDSCPRNLANAFAKPVQARGEQGLADRSVDELEKQWSALDAFYGDGGKTVFWNDTQGNFTQGQTAGSCAELVQSSVQSAVEVLKN